MLHQQVQRKQKNFALQRGLYVVRYEKAVDPSQPPVVTFVCEQGRNEVILHPDQSRPTMSAPGQCIVIRAFDTGSVQVELTTTGSAATLDATLKFEVLRGDAGLPAGLGPVPAAVPAGYGMPAAQPGMYAPAAASAPTAANIQVLGHVARRGDVTVAADEWLGGPAAPARIEGFLVRWPGRPSDVQLRYGVTLAGQRPGESRLVDVDDFAGTRGKARPILGVVAELVGPGAQNYSLTMEALFLGSPSRRGSGANANLAGPTGREPMVGLRLAVAAVSSSTLGSSTFGMPSQGMPMRPAQPSYMQPQAPAYHPSQAMPAMPQVVQPVQPPQYQPAPAAPQPAATGEPKRVRVFRA